MAPDSVIIGGSSGMGKAAAKACVRAGGRVLLASRDGDKLAAAQQEVIRDCDASQERVRTAVLDARDEAAVADFAAALDDGDYAGLVVSAAGRAPHGAVADLDVAATRELFESKYWTAYASSASASPSRPISFRIGTTRRSTSRRGSGTAAPSASSRAC